MASAMRLLRRAPRALPGVLGVLTGLFSLAEWLGLETGLFPSVEINWAVVWLLLSTIFLAFAAVLLLGSRKIVKLRNMRDEIARLSRCHDSIARPRGEDRPAELMLRDGTSKVLGFLAKGCRIKCPTKAKHMSIFFDELYRKIDHGYNLREIRKFFAAPEKDD